MLISADVSYFQAKVSSAYPRQWLIIRACDGSFLDPNASFNSDWCRGAVVQGRMLGWTAYVVYRPGMNAAILRNLAKIAGRFDRLMVDIEAWANTSSPIKGDHSDDINNLILDLAVLVGLNHVWRYGNRSDLASIHPRPLPGQLTLVAGYSATRPVVANQIGWQYTNGTENHTINPSSSLPFGRCDHNELYVDQLSPSGGGIPIVPATPSLSISAMGEDEMILIMIVDQASIPPGQPTNMGVWSNENGLHWVADGESWGDLANGLSQVLDASQKLIGFTHISNTITITYAELQRRAEEKYGPGGVGLFPTGTDFGAGKGVETAPGSGASWVPMPGTKPTIGTLTAVPTEYKGTIDLAPVQPGA